MMPMENKVVFPVPAVDYRLIRPTMFLEKNGNRDLSVQQATSVSIKNCKISFPTPNSMSLFLNKSWKEYVAADSIYKSVIDDKDAHLLSYAVRRYSY